ncbi:MULTISPECIES: alpha/beta hydrolase [unclassified Streptomyces]|uniref:alpha/beta hydrolase n=1 Tax=unclassified Streptomyces TaxID=2593676 RepID=UPI003819DCD8
MDTPRLLRTSGTVLAVAGLLLSACTTGGTSHSAAATSAAQSLKALPTDIPQDLRPYYEQKISWQSCKDMPGMQCGTMKAPLDYKHPSGGTDLTLAVARKKAAGPGKRIGSLLVNPGGPGGSAIDYLQYAAFGYPSAVTARYDMAAMDPRGVARSEPIVCLPDKQMDTFAATDVTPDNQAEIDKLVAEDKAFAKGCQQRSGKLLEHVTTVDAARDMDIFRSLLGDAKLNYVGKSYGTFIGATYAGLFPKRVGHLVLDGAMDPAASALESSRAQAGGFEVAFDAFAKDCVARRDCPLGTKSTADAGRHLDALLRSLDAKPLPTGSSRKLTEALGASGVISAMYDQSMWPTLRTGLTKASKGDGSVLLRLSDAYYERDNKGHFSNLMYANAAVNCTDLPPALTSPEAADRAVSTFREASPHFGDNLAWSSLICAYWPVRPIGHPQRIEARGAAPILVVGTTRDPATPYGWAKALAEQLDSGVLLTYNGDGHTAYARGNDCIDTAVNTYLLKGTPPAHGKTC